MKKQIAGLIYNTETSEEIADYDNGYFTTDFHHYSETLYRTKKGRWFIHRDGGALSTMAENCGGNGYCGSEDLEALSDQEALSWLKVHQELTLIETLFPGELEEA